MSLKKWLWPLLFTIIIVVGLSACGSSLKKPTGLEDQTTNNQTSQIDEEELDKLELDDEKTDKASEETTTNNSNENEGEVKETEEEQKSDHEEKKADQGTTDSKKTAKDKKANKQEKSTSHSSVKTKEKEKTKTDSNQSTKKSQPSKSNDKPKKEKPKAEKKPSTNEEKEEPKQTGSFVTYSIVISDNEVPLPPTKMEIKDEDSILQALIQIAKKNKIQMDYRGGQGSTAYVEGIDNVYEFDRGQGSGWMYRINGVFPDRGAGAVTLCDGDKVEWLYTTSLGQDLDADLKPVRRDGTCPK